MNLVNEIKDNWDSSPMGYIGKIQSLFDAGHEAWTIKTNAGYGVVILYDGVEEVFERFSDAVLKTDKFAFSDGQPVNVLLLTTQRESIDIPFSSLCAEFVYPGETGELRRQLLNNPVAWWSQWKELLGNKDIDARVYDVLGELVVLKYLAENGKIAEWNGPSGAIYDIDCETEYYEVKSSVSRSKRTITLSNRFQLTPPKGTELYLIFCQFEAALYGLCIDDLVNDLGGLGYSVESLNKKLLSMGLEKGRYDRRRRYMLHAMTKYHIDDSFPAIKPSSFVGGDLPQGIIGITYTVSLDGINGENLINQEIEENGVQNN